jgi:hypothetical protein
MFPARTTKLGRDVEVGDVLVFLGTHHRVTEFGPGTHLIEGSRIALAADGWGMTLDPSGSYEVA